MKVRNIILGVLIWSLPLWGVWAFEITGEEFPPGWGLALLFASVVSGVVGWFVATEESR